MVDDVLEDVTHARTSLQAQTWSCFSGTTKNVHDLGKQITEVGVTKITDVMHVYRG